MDAREQLRQVIDERQGRLASGVPRDREAALLALVGAIDGLPARGVPEPDVISSLAHPGLGVLISLHLGLSAAVGNGGDRGDLTAWAGGFLAECGRLAAARRVMRYIETGEMRLAANPGGGFDAWLPGRAAPASWVERADLDAWARRLAGARAGGSPAERLVDSMAWQAPYPSGAEIVGVPLTICRAALAHVIDLATVPHADAAGPVSISATALISSIADGLGIDRGLAGAVVSAFTLGPDNAAWHAELPGGPQAPLVRVGPDLVAVSLRGAWSEPFLFLLRELRRRDPESYHNAAWLREDAFRRDLYALFAERRFVTSVERIVLRREDRRNRTDVDAAIFDRKTGTLALFELKSQDPLARTADELERQRGSLQRAGHQVAVVLDWINRHGADDVLNRMDRGTAKRFRVQRVVPFVLGRYVVGEGSKHGRVAWGTWPQVLRVMDGPGGANPLLTLHARLLADDRSGLLPPPGIAPVEISLGEARIRVFASWEALQARRQEAR